MDLSGPTGNNINVIGAGAVSVAGNPGTSTLTINLSGTVAEVFDEDAGTAIPAGGILNIFGGSNINTSGAGNTVTINLDNTVHITNTMTADNGFISTHGDVDIISGNLLLSNTNGAGTSGIIEFGAGRFISNFGTRNVFVGNSSGNTTLTGTDDDGFGTLVLSALTTGSQNVAVGSSALTNLTTTNNNTAVGYNAGINLVTGANNTLLGASAGSTFTTNESNNIIIGSTGTIADSARIRIGTNGTQTSAFISGIYGVNVGSVASIVSIINTDQLGQTAIVAGVGITVTTGANTITISSSGTSTLNYTNVNHAASPYTVLSTDEYISVDCSAGVVSLLFPNAATSGRAYIVKDRTGNAQTNNISVTTVGGAVNIDGVTTYTMNTKYSSIELMGNASSYEIF